MDTEIEEISQAKRRITIEIESEKVTQKLDQAYRELSKKVKIKGFRPGKAPQKILEQYYGKQIVNEVKNDLIGESFSKVIEESGLFPLASPSIEDGALRPGEHFKYTLVLEVRPDFELKDYMGISVEKEILNISEDSVDKKLEEIREAHAQLIPINEDREVQEGDYVIIDYRGFWKEKSLKDIEAKDFAVLVGSNHFYPELEAGIVGLKKGAEKEIKTDFKEDFNDKRLAGKSVVFLISIKDIKKKDLPELNDDFAKSLGDNFHSLQELKERVRQEITLQEEKRIDRELKNRLLRKVAATVDFELPQTIVEREIERSIASITHGLVSAGSQLESAGISEEKMRQDMRPVAEQKVKENLVLGKIADMEDIRVEAADIRDGFKDLATRTRKDPAALQQFYEKNNLMDSFRDQLLTEKTLNHLVQGATIVEVKEIVEES